MRYMGAHEGEGSKGVEEAALKAPELSASVRWCPLVAVDVQLCFVLVQSCVVILYSVAYRFTTRLTHLESVTYSMARKSCTPRAELHYSAVDRGILGHSFGSAVVLACIDRAYERG